MFQYRGDPTAIILALPRGGVAVGYQVSLGLHLPLDVFIARKLGAPDNLEYALGSVGETGTIYLNPDAITVYDLSSEEIEDLAQVQQQEIARRQDLYRQSRQFSTLIDRTVILVDDGIATCSTFFASAKSIKHLKPRRLIGAIPVGPIETIREVRTGRSGLWVTIILTLHRAALTMSWSILNLAEGALRERSPSLAA